MAFKLLLLKHYLEGKKIIYIISHDFSVYLGMILKYLFILVGLLFLYRYANGYFSGWMLNWAFAIGGIVVYIFFVIKFLDLYLDSVVLTSTGLVIFLWDGLFKYELKTLDREKIGVVVGEQTGLLDMVFKKGAIKMQLEDKSFYFRDVVNPRKQAQMIVETKETLTNRDDIPQDMDKFDVLVETLGEVIVDYIKNNKNKSSETYFG